MDGKDKEKRIEALLKRRVEENGGLAIKYESNFTAGYPDRIVMLPGGDLTWVELKTKGRKPRKLQSFRHEELKRLGQDVRVIDTAEGVEEFIKEKTNGI